jgi:hypothetical protein
MEVHVHKDESDLARRLFATAMAKLEDATHIAARGQSAQITAGVIRREAAALREVARDLVTIADTAVALTHRIDTRLPPQRKLK